MHEQSSPPDACYSLIGTRKNGSHATVMGSMTYEEARKARDAVAAAGIFASIEIAIDSGDDIQSLQ